MPKKVTFLIEALKNMVSQSLVPNVAFLAEPITKSRGDILSVAGRELAFMYIVDEGEIGVIEPKQNLPPGKRLMNMKSVDLVLFNNIDVVTG